MMDWSFLPPAKESSSWLCFSIAQTNWTFQRQKTFYWGSAIKLCSTYWKNRDMNFDGWIVSDFFYSSWSKILDTYWEEDLHMMTTDLELLGSHFEMIEALEGLGIKELWWYMKINTFILRTLSNLLLSKCTLGSWKTSWVHLFLTRCTCILY